MPVNLTEQIVNKNENSRRTNLLFKLLMGSAILLNSGIILICFLMPQNIMRWITVLSIINIVSISLIFLNKKGYTLLSSYILVISYMLLIIGLAWSAGGVNAPVIQYTPVVILFAVLLLGRNKGIIFGIAAAVASFGLVIAAKLNVLPPNVVFPFPLSSWVNSTTCIGLIILLGIIYMDEIKKALTNAHSELNLRLQSESRLKTISNNFTDGMIYQVVFEPNGSKKFTYLSDSVKQLYGISPEEGMANENLIYSRIHKDDLSSVLAAEEQSFKTLVTFKIEARMKDPSGEIRWSSFVSTPRILEDGSVCFDGIEFIITKAKQIEEVLRENEERFRELSSVTQEGIMIHEGGVILDANQSFAEMIGYSNPDLLIGKNGLDIVPFTPESRNLIISHLSSGSTEMEEIEIVRPDGSLMPAETLGKEITYRGRNARVVSMRDISSRKKLISDLIEAKDQAESASKLKDAFIANISHEIRTPLTGLLGMTNLIKEIFQDNGSNEYQEVFEGIDLSSRRIIRTVDMILNYSRMQVGEYPINKKEVSVSSICLNLVKVYSLVAKHKSLDLTFRNNCGDAAIFTDEYSITMAVSNLLDNAVKYTDKGFINVELLKGENGDIILNVSDTGIGISEDYMGKLFEPYHQEQMGYGRAYEGVGLGLSLVKQVLSLNNANIFVESKKGEGSTFSINFGKEINKIEHLSGEALKTYVPLQYVGINLVLIVEDDPLNQITIKKFIESRYRTIIVDSSEDAIEILKSNNIDLILMDISIKGKMNGLELTRMLKESKEYSKIPVIAVTAHAFEKDKQAALEAGCDSYLSKPFSKDSLLELIDIYSIKLKS